VRGIAEAYDPRLFEPVKVRDLGGGKYELLDGHHRLAAVKLLKLDAIPAIVVESTDDSDRLALQVAANNARAKDDPETLGNCYRQLLDLGKSEAEAARAIGVTAGTAKRYLALTEVTAELRDWYRDGRLPLEVIAMIAEHELSPGAQRKLAEAYIREKAQHPKFQPVDFRLFVDEFSRQLLAGSPTSTQTLLVNPDEDPAELQAIERAEKALARQKAIDLEKRIKRALDLLSDPQVAEAVAARLDSWPPASETETESPSEPEPDAPEVKTVAYSFDYAELALRG